MMTVAEMDKRFTYHAPKGTQPKAFQDIRSAGREFAWLIDRWCKDSREKSIAITKLEEAVMWANASIARNGTEESG